MEVRTWFEVPAIAHFFHVFRDAYNLIEFDIEDLETTLLRDTHHEECFYPDLLISLLRAWFSAEDGVEVTLDNYDYYLQVMELNLNDDIFKIDKYLKLCVLLTTVWIEPCILHPSQTLCR